MDVEQLKAAREALLEFCTKLGISDGDLSKGETVSKIRYYSSEYPTTRFDKVLATDFEQMAAVFGDAVQASISIGDLLVIQTKAQSGVADLKAELAGHNEITLDLCINKNKICQSVGLEAPGAVFHCYFYAERLTSLLAESLGNFHILENALWGNAKTGKVVICLLDRDCHIEGPMLAILGGQYLGRVSESSEALPHHWEEASTMFASAAQAIRWSFPAPRFLTPLHLQVSQEPAEPDDLTTSLFAHWTNLSMAFTADWVTERGSVPVAVYATEQAKCEIQFIGPPSNGPGPIEWEAAAALGNVAGWAHEPQWGTNKLRMVQVRLARALSFEQQPAPAKSLLIRVQALWVELQWHWKTFISDSIEQYSEDERKFENQISEAVDAFDNQVSEMIKSLSGTMLAAVGVLIGSLIAGAFKSDFNASVFRIGLTAYAVYLVLFPGIYNMAHHCLRFCTLNRTLRERQNRFSKVIDPTVVQRIAQAHLPGARRQFWIWFVLTIVAMVGVLIGCCVAYNMIPPMMATP